MLRSGPEQRHLRSICGEAGASPGLQPPGSPSPHSRPGRQRIPHAARKQHASGCPVPEGLASAMTKGSRGQPPGKTNRSPGEQEKRGLARLAGLLPRTRPPGQPCTHRGKLQSLRGKGLEFDGAEGAEKGQPSGQDGSLLKAITSQLLNVREDKISAFTFILTNQ